MIMLTIKGTEVLVQLAYKKVIKYDKNWNKIKEYNSVQECLANESITKFKLKRYSDNDILYEENYSKIQPHKSQYIEAECDYCHKTFLCQRWRTEIRKNLFCSKDCEAQFRTAPPNCICEICGKPIHRKNYQLKKNKHTYCSYDCAKEAKKALYKGEGNHQYGLKGSKNGSWKSDERISYYGYRLIRQLDHPFKNCDDFVFEHRLVAEKFLLNDKNSVEINGKKYLAKDYIVHHLDFNKLNNDVSNLIVMKLSEHCSLHMTLENHVDEFKKYCDKYNLDFEQVYATHLYNKKHYKYEKQKVC